MKLRMHREKQRVKSEKNLGYTVTEPYGDFDTGRVGVCLWKAMLMFGAAFGTILSIVSAFDLQVNLPLLLSAFLLLSLLLSFLHYHHVLFNIGYPIAFFAFAFSIFQNRRYVNSGYQAIVNQVKEDYRTYFQLNYSGEGYEAVDNRYLAMTYAFLYLGFFLIVLLNIAISNYMSIFLTMLFTFPFLQFGLYIGKMPSLVSVFLLLFVYAAVLFFKRSGHYSLSERRKKDQAFVAKKNVFSYKGQGKVMGQLLGITLGIILLFSLAAYPVMGLALPGSEKTSTLKAATDSTIENLVQSGFSSLLNRYDATGGVSGGKLGGVNRIKADYNTDLEVTFVPSSLEPLYLKAYTGAEYTGDQWVKPDYEESWKKSPGLYPEYENFTARLEAARISRYEKEQDQQLQQGKMTIKNVDGDSNYLYLPYYSQTERGISAGVDHSILCGSSPKNLTYTSTYYPYTQELSALQGGADQLLVSETTDAYEKKYIKSYETYCKDVYTRIPENISQELSALAEEIGTGKTPQETAEGIRNYLEENYSYSMNPGATPPGQDFVTWFLDRQKKGFCTHFATAGTLLCRACGIPARYVEGYVIQTTDIAEAKLLEEENPKEWFTGTNELQKSGVVTVSVPDANAHAWTEIYLEGFGWIPVDFTPPSGDVDEAEEYSSILQLFAGLFSVQQGENTAENTDIQQGGMTAAVGTALEQNSFILMPLAVVVLVLLALVTGWRLAVYFRPKVKRMQAYRRGHYDEVLSYDYRSLVHSLQKRHRELEIPSLPEGVFELIRTLTLGDLEKRTQKGSVFGTSCEEKSGEPHQPNDPEIQEIYRLLEKGLYGQEQLPKEEADLVIRFLAECKKIYKKTQKFDIFQKMLIFTSKTMKSIMRTSDKVSET